MRAAFDDTPMIQNADQIRVSNRRDTMRDDQRRAIGTNIAQIAKDPFLGVRVDRRQRIIEYQYPRIAHHGSSDRGPLFLPAGKRDPALADELLILLRKRSNIGCETGDVGGFLDGNM